MTNQDNHSKAAADLRQKAEALARERTARTPEDSAALSPDEIRETLYELRVHQIELEMQNEELRRAQAQIEAGRERYFDLYDLAPVGYCTLSEQGLILEANLTAATLLGTTRGMLVKQPISRFILKDDQDIYYLHRKRLIETGEAQECELRLVKPDGALFWAHLEENAAQADDGAPVFRVVLSDITERVELENKRQQIVKMESLNRMAGAIAHHFNNMLSIVIGNLELALDDSARGVRGVEDLSDYLSEAMHGALSAAEMSAFMLTYTGQSQERMEAHDLSEVCEEIVAGLNVTMPHGIRLVTDLSVSPESPVNVTPDLVRQALTHLIANAQEAIKDEEGEIRVAVITVQGMDISRTAVWPPDWKPAAEEYAVIQVTDTGCGISAEDLGKVMDPFFSTKAIGSGIGLPVVLGIALTHEGAVTVESEPGIGSTFQVLFPLADQETTPDRDTVIEPVPSLETGGRILLIEDEEGVRNIIGAILRRLGFDVIMAKDGMEALDVFRSRSDEIGLVITDLTMPRMNGWETLAALREIRSDIPVILASGYDEAHVMASDHAEKPQAFLQKPFEIETLRKTLERVLGLDRIHRS